MKNLFFLTVVCICSILTGCIFQLGDSIQVPDKLQINSANDIDLYCDYFFEKSSFDGSIAILSTDESLDLSCFKGLKTIKGGLILQSQVAAEAFCEIEEVGGEGLAFGRKITKKVSFDKLKDCTSIKILSDAEIKSLEFPNVEKIDNVTFASFCEVGNFEGLNDVRSTSTINMPIGNAKIDNLDFFANLEKIEAFLLDLPIETELAPNSFDELIEISLFADISKNNLGYTLNDLFPKIKSCSDFSISSDEMELSDFCYLKKYIENEELKIMFNRSASPSVQSQSFTSQEILEDCN